MKNDDNPILQLGAAILAERLVFNDQISEAKNAAIFWRVLSERPAVADIFLRAAPKIAGAYVQGPLGPARRAAYVVTDATMVVEDSFLREQGWVIVPDQLPELSRPSGTIFECSCDEPCGDQCAICPVHGAEF